MKNVILTRNLPLTHTTPGALSVPDGNGYQRCATLELQPQDRFGGKKQAGITRFAAGVYKMLLWTTDKAFAAAHKHARYAPHSKWARRYTPRYGGVVEICVGTEADGDQWAAVLFHGGNKRDQTLGCTLCGEAFRYRDEFLLESTKALNRIYPPLVKAVLRGALLEVR